MSIVEGVSTVCAVTMPLWNIPLIIKICKRRSSQDLSLVWVIGVWLSIVGMLPSVLSSSDMVYKFFGIMNVTMFTCVTIVAIRFHK